MGPVYDQPLKQNADNLLARMLLVGKIADEEVEESVAEELGMAVRVTELIGNSAKEVVTSFRL